MPAVGIASGQRIGQFDRMLVVDPKTAPPAAEGALLLRADIMERFDFGAIFGNSQPVELELGAGDGSFIGAYAALHPEHNFLAVERLLGRLRKIDRKGRRAGVLNLRGVRVEAAYLLEWMIRPETLSAIHVYFPDPWPKRKHWRRRLINESFTRLARTALLPDGVVYLRTDDESYFNQMVEVFGANADFATVAEPMELLDVKTDFERGFNAQGIATRHAAYRRIR